MTVRVPPLFAAEVYLMVILLLVFQKISGYVAPQHSLSHHRPLKSRQLYSNDDFAQSRSLLAMNAAKKPSGSFFNPVPDNDNDDDVSESNTNDNEPPQNQQNNSSSDLNSDSDTQDDVDKSLQKLMQDRQRPSLASQPSTINGIPTSQAGVGFGGSKSQAKKKQKQKQKQSSYTAIGTPDLDDDSAKSAIDNNGFANKPLNDVTRPEYDDQGYTLYADEETGEKSRVFEALVDYPCKFTMKIVGANEGTFVEEILQVVADSCNVDDVGNIQHKTRTMGKWTSVTVQAPVDNAEMLYELYENIDKDPRVKFKF